MELDFVVDRITESIERAETGERVETLVLPVTSDAEVAGATPANGWRFDWSIEYRKPERQIYKLVTKKEQDIIQGLVALVRKDKEKLVLMPLIENAPPNLGDAKMYEGVCANLVAYGCKMSRDLGFDGYLSFDAKTKLIGHYVKTLRATHLGGLKMGMIPPNSDWLINNYFNN